MAASHQYSEYSPKYNTGMHSNARRMQGGGTNASPPLGAGSTGRLRVRGRDSITRGGVGVIGWSLPLKLNVRDAEIQQHWDGSRHIRFVFDMAYDYRRVNDYIQYHTATAAGHSKTTTEYNTAYRSPPPPPPQQQQQRNTTESPPIAHRSLNVPHASTTTTTSCTPRRASAFEFVPVQSVTSGRSKQRLSFREAMSVEAERRMSGLDMRSIPGLAALQFRAMHMPHPLLAGKAQCKSTPPSPENTTATAVAYSADEDSSADEYSSAVQLQPSADSSAVQLQPSADSSAVQLQPSADSSAVQLQPSADSSAVQLQPSADSSAVQLQPSADSSAVQLQ
eukprot:Lankesteria_metandrocarpae@DN8185_c0_g1_i1.p1